VRSLKPEPEPQDYQLWFIVDGLPLSGGVFDAKAGKTALLAADAIPAGTTAVAVTLERKGGTASPTSPILLTADSPVQL
jgi:anti-sigma-K factor RskA